ncbi:MAG: TIGR01777 family protein [Candidatus Eisenbacteria bacterium]|nr:TIGR01777 family protein [Candidatus Eisenbacteria bacterium]
MASARRRCPQLCAPLRLVAHCQSHRSPLSARPGETRTICAAPPRCVPAFSSTGRRRGGRMRRIVLTGGTGLIGGAFLRQALAAGLQVRALTRDARQAHRSWSASRPPASETDRRADLEWREWDPAATAISPDLLDGADAVVHLAGEPLALRPLTPGLRRRLWHSRVTTTRRLATTATELPRPPALFVSASAVGYYGDRGGIALQESDPPGEGFLSRLCVAWEAAARVAGQASTRVVSLRFGIVLSPAGGVLARILPLARYGLAGRLGSGDQIWAWVSHTDAARAILTSLQESRLRGPLNVVAPQAVSQREFARAVAQRVGRRGQLPVPARVLRLLLGSAADELLLGSARALPHALESAGFRFEHADLRTALAAL